MQEENFTLPTETVLVKISDIKISENRFRKIFNEAKDEAFQISFGDPSTGLQTPPLVTNDLKLIAGETRLRNWKKRSDFNFPNYYLQQLIPEGLIPVRRALRDFSLLERLKMERDENLVRSNFTVSEEAAAVKRIYMLEKEISEAQVQVPENAVSLKKPQPASLFVGLLGAPKFVAEPDLVEATAKSVFDTTKPTTSETRAIQNSLKIATAMETIPELASILEKAKDKTAALSAIEKFEKEERNKVLAASVGKEFTSKFRHKVYQGDCLKILGKMESSLYDICLTDPLYGINAHQHKRGGENHNYEDTPERFTEIMPRIIRQVSRVLKPAAHFYMFCDLDNFHKLKNWIQDSSLPGNLWTVQRTPIFYRKPPGISPHPGFTYARSYECIIYAYRGGKTLQKTLPDILDVVPQEKSETHGAAKQPEALKQILSASSKPGEKVLDFMAGSGSIFPACQDLLLEATGIEIAEAYYGRCLERIEQLLGK